MKERRKFKRYKARLDTRYTEAKGYVTIQSLSTTKNICLGGLSAALSRIVKRKDLLLIELDSFRNKKLAALARVMWIKPAGNNGSNLCGLKFLWVSSKALLHDCLLYVREISAAP